MTVHDTPSRQRGQSLIETLVGLIVLAPLAVGIMLIGQYSHLDVQTELAAREAAWAAAEDPALARKSLPVVRAEQQALRAREFATPASALRSAAPAPGQLADSMLTTYAGGSLLRPNDITLAYSQTGAPSVADEALQLVGAVTRLLPDSGLPPNPNGLLTARVDARTEPLVGADGQAITLLGPWAANPLTFSAKTVLLADSWEAAGGGETLDGNNVTSSIGPRTVRQVISPLVPMDWFRPLNRVSRIVTRVLGLVPLVGAGLSGFQPGRTAPDVVPADKLVPYRPAGGG